MDSAVTILDLATMFRTETPAERKARCDRYKEEADRALTEASIDRLERNKKTIQDRYLR